MEGHAETPLGTREDSLGDASTQYTLEKVLALAPAHPEAGRETTGELHQRVIQERHARFERDGHAHAVQLGQDIPGQIGLDVEILQA